MQLYSLRFAIYGAIVAVFVFDIVYAGMAGAQYFGFTKNLKYPYPPGKLRFAFAYSILSAIKFIVFFVLFKFVGRGFLAWLHFDDPQKPVASNANQQTRVFFAFNMEPKKAKMVGALITGGLLTLIWIIMIPLSFFSCSDLCGPLLSTDMTWRVKYTTTCCTCNGIGFDSQSFTCAAPPPTDPGTTYNEQGFEQSIGIEYHAAQALAILIALLLGAATALTVLLHSQNQNRRQFAQNPAYEPHRPHNTESAAVPLKYDVQPSVASLPSHYTPTPGEHREQQQHDLGPQPGYGGPLQTPQSTGGSYGFQQNTGYQQAQYTGYPNQNYSSDNKTGFGAGDYFGGAAAPAAQGTASRQQTRHEMDARRQQTQHEMDAFSPELGDLGYGGGGRQTVASPPPMYGAYGRPS